MTDAARDKYLQKKYNVTILWYNEKLVEQGGGCAICGSKPLTRSLPVDHEHDHKIKSQITYKIYKVCTIGKQCFWNVRWNTPTMVYLSTNFTSNKQARKFIKDRIKFRSVRGIICFSCNGGLRKFRDNPKLLEAAAKYLKSYQVRLNGTN